MTHRVDPFAVLSAGLLITSPRGDVMLLETSYKDPWEIPGGFVEPAESPAAACRRELREELGLDRAAGPLLVADWAPSEVADSFMLFIFDGGQMTEDERRALTFPDGEILAAHFVSPDAMGDVTTPRLVTRVRQALAARDVDSARYLEHGSPIV